MSSINYTVDAHTIGEWIIRTEGPNFEDFPASVPLFGIEAGDPSPSPPLPPPSRAPAAPCKFTIHPTYVELALTYSSDPSKVPVGPFRPLLQSSPLPLPLEEAEAFSRLLLRGPVGRSGRANFRRRLGRPGAI